MNNRIRNILYVDDDAIECAAAKRLLESMALAEQVTLFSDSMKGLTYLRQLYSCNPAHRHHRATDLILLNLKMSGFGGFEMHYMLRVLKERGIISLRDTYFALVTSVKSDQRLRMALPHDVLAVLDKPLYPEQVRSLINNIPTRRD